MKNSELWEYFATISTKPKKNKISSKNYVIEVTEIILNLFIFFHEKILSVKKAPNVKKATFVHAKKLLPLLFFCSLIFVLLGGFLFVSVFVRAESFRKKKIK